MTLLFADIIPDSQACLVSQKMGEDEPLVMVDPLEGSPVLLLLYRFGLQLGPALMLQAEL